MAPPPIQLPAKVDSPLHIVSGPAPLNNSGKNMDKIKIDIGPPIIIPNVPVKNIIKALYPKLYIAFRSILNVIRSSAAGSKYLLAI